VWSIVKFVLSDMYCLARDCADDKIIRKFVVPALELIMLDKALRGEYSREKALLRFGEMYATALAGDGTVWRRLVELAVGGGLGGGAALLRLAAYGEDAARFMHLLAVTAPSAGGKYLSEKFEEFMKETRVEVQLDKNSIRLTDGGNVTADLTISEAGITVKYNVYLSKNAIKLQFVSTDRSRVELAAWLLKLAGVDAEVKKEGGRDVWRIDVTTNRLAAGREELRNALAEIVREAIARG
jgi:hypothetical protein